LLAALTTTIDVGHAQGFQFAFRQSLVKNRSFFNAPPIFELRAVAA
jgi:hypothetical protein